MDRVRATRLALKCCEFLESEALKQRSASSSASSKIGSGAAEKSYSDDTAVMITIQGSTICFTSATEMAKNADMKNRRGKTAWWHEFKALVELLGGRTALAEL